MQRSIYTSAWFCNNSLAHAVSHCVHTVVHSFSGYIFHQCPIRVVHAYYVHFMYTYLTGIASGGNGGGFPPKKKPRIVISTTVFLSPVPPTKSSWSFSIRGWAGLRGCPSEDRAAGGLVVWALPVRLSVAAVPQRVRAQVVQRHGQQHPPYHDQKEARAAGSLLHGRHLL